MWGEGRGRSQNRAGGMAEEERKPQEAPRVEGGRLRLVLRGEDMKHRG